eukprot:TRINITY_DN12331_c0_g1_i1.p1 TRINITY_DN12331_c0_g1~~TRINITY_DN12331_c0_g1_i1.p1  ORF type:complete len:214 (-),score=68.47 TRINITY_DN12331_c0_g1_i1:139-780(-)
MKLAILGATGKTGIEAVKQALAENHTVTAIVRNPAKITVAHDNLKVVEADIFDVEALKAQFSGQDAIVSCLGFPPQKPAVTGYLEVTKNVVSAMKSSSVSRLVVCHSWYTEEESRGKAMFLIRWILLPMIKTVLNNMRETEVWLDAEADVDYTVVRPAGLTDAAVTEGEFKVAEGDYHVEGAAGRIARADVARFMLSTLQEEKYYKKQLAIAV